MQATFSRLHLVTIGDKQRNWLMQLVIFSGVLASEKARPTPSGLLSKDVATRGNRSTDGTRMAKFVLTLYVVVGSPQLGPEIERLRRICRKDLPRYYDVQVMNVADRVALSGDMRIFAPNTAVLWLPAPLQDSISGLVRAKLGLVGLDLRRTDGTGNGQATLSQTRGSADETKDVRSRLSQLEVDLAERSVELAKTREAFRQIEQVLVNLIQNAVEATDGPATITIQTAEMADTVRLTVLDRGCGIDERQKQRLFDLLFTTRKGRGGTGLGLSASNSIVGSHGGSIAVESTVGEGTMVAVTLPPDEELPSGPPVPCHISNDPLRKPGKM